MSDVDAAGDAAAAETTPLHQAAAAEEPRPADAPQPEQQPAAAAPPQPPAPAARPTPPDVPDDAIPRGAAGVSPDVINFARDMAAFYVRTGALRYQMLIGSYIEALQQSRVNLVLLMFLSGVTGVLCIIGTLESNFSNCCVPADCTNVDALNGQLPAFSFASRVCALTPEQASAMSCDMPNMTSKLLNDESCQHLSAPCPSPFYATAMIIGAGVLCVFFACAALILPSFGKSMLLIIISWILVIGSGLLAIILVTVGGAMVNTARGLTDTGVQSDNNNMPIHFDACLNMTSARGIALVDMSTTLSQGQYLAYTSVLLGFVFILTIPVVWFRRYKRLRIRVQRHIIAQVLGIESDSDDGNETRPILA